jgi:extracellular factor (EF) 3-hydroxypalmitic acid methyl ester biosynthesis protein
MEEGSGRQTLFFLMSGVVRVERSHLGQAIAYARLAAGSVFGEMSFLEQRPASASVVAEEDSELAVIEGAILQSLIASVPGFGTRFYQSIAVVLSERLRETASLLPALLVEEVPQVARFHERRASRTAAELVPPTVVSAVDAFKHSMLDADRAIVGGKLADDEARDLVGRTCDSLHDALRMHVERESRLEDAIGNFVFREAFPFLMQSPVLDRSFSKPRGYAGDYETIDLIYENTPSGYGRLAPLIDHWALNIPVARAVRSRRTMMTELIRTRASTVSRPLRLTSLASGPARELFDLLEVEPPRFRALCVDIDPLALEHAATTASERGAADRFVFVRENVLRMIHGRGETAVEPQDLIYSLGLIDYFDDQLVIALLDWIHDHLEPGGLSVLGNFDTSTPNRAFLDHVLDWKVIYRNAGDLERLYERSKFAGRVAIEHEQTGVQLFAIATRP